jgi:hypothetical protein
MPFIKIKKSRTGLHETEPVMAMAAYLADGKFKSRIVNFRFNRMLLGLLGWEVHEGRIRLAVHEGTGTDKGLLQIVPDPGGYSGTRVTDGHGIAITVSIDRFKHYVLNECPMPSNLVNYIIDDDILIIECPDWLRFNPLSEELDKVTQLHPKGGRRRA